MKNEWRIRSLREEVALIAASRASAEERKSAMAPDRAVQRIRLPLKSGQSTANRRFLAAILSEIESANSLLSRMSTDWLQDRVERAVREGRLLAIPSTVPVGRGLLTAEEPGGPPENGPAETVPDKTWIEIQILDFNDKPLAGHPYTLELPDGSVREGTVGADGLARVVGIDPGNCRLTWKRQKVAMYHFEEAGTAGNVG